MLKQIQQNFSYLFVSEVAVRALTLIFTISLARIYGPEQFGIYGLALSIGGLFDIIFNLGLATIFMQRVAADPKKMREQLGIFLPLRAILSFGLLFTFSLFILILQKEAATSFALLITGVYFSLSSISVFLWACFDAQQKMAYTAILKLLLYVITVAIGMFLITQRAAMYMILGSYIMGAGVALIATVIIIHSKFAKISWKWNVPEWKKSSPPVGRSPFPEHLSSSTHRSIPF